MHGHLSIIIPMGTCFSSKQTPSGDKHTLQGAQAANENDLAGGGGLTVFTVSEEDKTQAPALWNTPVPAKDRATGAEVT